MEREARRKRIMERGSDRLVLISGWIHSLDPLSSLNSFFGKLSMHSKPSDNYRGHAYSASDSAINDTIFFPDHSCGGNDTSNIWLRDDIIDDGISQDTKSEAKVAEVEQSEVKSVSKASYDAYAKPLQKPFGNLFSSITPRDINFCIITSENTRVFFSIVIAILVVLSQVNLPRKVVKSKSFIAWRPLNVVLLTGLMIVAA